MTISKEILDELLKGVERPEGLLGDAGLMKELQIKLMERMLGAELTAHLGYEEGESAPPSQPNRRNGRSTKVLRGQDGELPVANIPKPSHQMKGQKWPTFTPSATTLCRRYRGRVLLRRSQLSQGVIAQGASLWWVQFSGEGMQRKITASLAPPA